MADEYDDSDETGDDGTTGYAGAPPLALMMQNQYTTPEALGYARKFLDKNLSGADRTEEQDYLTKVKEASAKTRAALQAAREQLAAKKYGNSEAWLAASAGFGAPTKTGAIGETMANVAGNLIDPIRKKREWETTHDKNLGDLDIAMAGIDENDLKAQLELLKLRQQMSRGLTLESLKTVGRQVGNKQAMEIPRKAQEAVDKAFAKEYVDFNLTGASDSAKALEELGSARDQLRGYRIDKDTGEKVKLKKNDFLTGPIVGNLSNIPFLGKPIQDTFFPQSSNVQEMVEYTVQRSLRPILGSQFTKEEGERLIARVYNPRLSEETNASRLDRLIKQLQRAYDSKRAAAKYFEQHNTLLGFKGKTRWSVEDLAPEAGGGGGSPKPPKKDNYIDPSSDPWGGGDIQYEDLIPAGEEYAEGGSVDAPDEHEGRVARKMPDGRVVWAPPEVPIEKILKRYEAATKQHFEQEPQPAPDQEEPNPAVQEQTMGLSPQSTVDMAGYPIGQSILGAGAGYAGGKYGTKLMQSMADFVPGHRTTSAEGRVLRGLENEGLDPQTWAKLQQQAQRFGVPATAMDVGGMETRALGEAALNPDNPETRDFYKTLRDRQAGARGRVEDRINNSLKPDEYFSKMKDLRKNLREGSADAYGDLYKQFPSIKSDSLMQVLSTPSGKKAVKEAVKAIRDRPGATLGKADAMGMVTKPSLEFLDQVKYELDDMIGREEGSGVNYKATKKGNRMRNIRNALRDEMDMATTDPKTQVSAYKEARAQHAGNLEVMDALRMGREDFLQMAPKEIETAVKDMSFVEKDALRSGVAQKLFEQVRSQGSRANAATKIIDSPDMLDRFHLIFDKPNEFKVFKEALETEARMFEDSKTTISKAQRALRSGVAKESNVIKRTAKDAPTLGIGSALQWTLRLLRRSPTLGKKESAEIIRILRTSDPKAMQKLADRLGPKMGRSVARKKLAGKAGIGAAVLGAAYPIGKQLMNDSEEIPEEESDDDSNSGPTYARGGLVRKPQWKLAAELSLASSLGDFSLLAPLVGR